MKISIIIPNYNGAHLLKNNLPKVINAVSSKTEYEIVISDDASVDNSLEILKELEKQYKKIKVITSSVNKGFSTNVNRGVNAATGELIVLLNTDVIPKKNFLEPLLERFNDENVFAVGCMDESIENGKTVLRGRGVGDFRRGFLTHRAGELDYDTTLWVSGGSGMFRKSIWDKLGGLDSLFDPFYWEDIDLSYRALKSGYKIYFEKKSVVIHEHEKGAIKSKYSPNQVKKIAYRNQFIFMWKNSNFGTLISSVFWLPYHLLKAVLRRDWAFISALFMALGKLNLIIKSRRKAFKLFLLPDRKVTEIAK